MIITTTTNNNDNANNNQESFLPRSQWTNKQTTPLYLKVFKPSLESLPTHVMGKRQIVMLRLNSNVFHMMFYHAWETLCFPVDLTGGHQLRKNFGQKSSGFRCVGLQTTQLAEFDKHVPAGKTFSINASRKEARKKHYK